MIAGSPPVIPATRLSNRPVPDVLQHRALGQDLEELVGLLLVFHDRIADLRVLEDVDHLVGDGVLVERDGDRTQRLRRDERPVQARPVRADHGDVVAAAYARLREPAREPLDLVAHLAPGPRLPDAQVLLANGRAITALARVTQ
jgi:hypothetical protein